MNFRLFLLRPSGAIISRTDELFIQLPIYIPPRLRDHFFSVFIFRKNDILLKFARMHKF